MPTTYQRAPEHVTNRVMWLMEQYHAELFEFGVSVDVLCAYADPEKDEPAVKLAGYRCLAKVRSVSYKDRVKGCADAEIIIDGDELFGWTERELDAILDHELTHLEINRDSEGNAKTDDLGRPRFKLRKHDIHFGWFDSIADRYGKDSQEVKQAHTLIEDWEFCQLYLPGFDAKDMGKIKPEELEVIKKADAEKGETSSYVTVSTGKRNSKKARLDKATVDLAKAEGRVKGKKQPAAV